MIELLERAFLWRVQFHGYYRGPHEHSSR